MKNTGTKHRNNGYNFFHVRNFTTEKVYTISGSTLTVSTKKNILARGGVCYAWKLESDKNTNKTKSILVGRAICNKLDNYSKEIGRNLAVESIELHEYYQIIDISDFDTWAKTQGLRSDDFSTIDVFLEELLGLKKF
jgi:hypothetical protein